MANDQIVDNLVLKDQITYQNNFSNLVQVTADNEITGYGFG